MSCLASSLLQDGHRYKTWANTHNEIEQLIGNHQCSSERKKKEEF